jgi:F-type H+-transporting ATPase subunit b
MVPVVGSILADNYLVWWAAQLVAVAILVFLVLRWRPKFLRGRTIGQTLDGALTAREEQIKVQLEAAEESRKEAARILAESAKDVENARVQADDIVARALHTSEAIQREITERAQDEAMRIVEQTQAEIEYETRQAEMALRRRAADIVIDAAEQIVERHLEPSTDRRLIEKSLANLRDIG